MIKQLKYLVLPLGLGAVLAFNTYTPKKSNYTPRDTFKYHLTGKVVDKASDVEIGGASVKVEHKNVELSSSPSGEDGSYELKFESTIQYTGAELIYVITREGYKDKRVPNVPIQPSQPIIVNFKLERKPASFRRDLDANRWETIEYIKELQRY